MMPNFLMRKPRLLEIKSLAQRSGAGKSLKPAVLTPEPWEVESTEQLSSKAPRVTTSMERTLCVKNLRLSKEVICETFAHILCLIPAARVGEGASARLGVLTLLYGLLQMRTKICRHMVFKSDISSFIDFEFSLINWTFKYTFVSIHGALSVL